MSALRVSVALPPCKDAPAFARVAEEAGLDGFYLYDSPGLYGDVWMGLGRCAETTKSITLGTGVAVASLRHPMVTASAIAALEELAPGRVVVGIGSGFTARKTMGQGAMPWEDMRTYLTQLKALLRGEVVQIDGGKAQMIHSPGFAPPRPLLTPLIVAASGPKGYAVAREVGDGVFCDREVVKGFDRCLRFTFGTVLDPGEDHTSARVKASAGAFYTTGYHAMWEMRRDVPDKMPGGADWLARVDAARPEDERHLAVHKGHMVAVNPRDAALIETGGPGMLLAGLCGPDEVIRARLAEMHQQGASEVVMSLAGDDIGREIRALARAAGKRA
jgi:5,10-methylenetetrahydromethanopterin reductase